VTICIVDTTVFCNILDVPGYNQDKDEALATLRDYINQPFSLLLPLATVYETGNHIAHVPDGQLRREVAARFAREVSRAVDGASPWTPTPLPEAEELASWLAEFPDHAMRGVSLADLSIIKVFERQCELHRARRVFIWSYDQHLHGYDRAV
jgi:hypothetical protein